MSRTWRSDAPPPAPRALGARDWARAARRGGAVILTLVGGIVLLACARLVEWPTGGRWRRPLSGRVVQGVCRLTLRWLGIGHRTDGARMAGPGALVSNHASWLDIFALNAADRVIFVSKAEVAGWPGIGLLARIAGTVFIRRDRAEAAAQTALFSRRLTDGQRLLFFPEGTSTDGLRVLRFNPTLFQAFLDPAMAAGTQIQPVTVVWRAPEGADPRYYGWWGDMAFGASLVQILATPRPGSVEVIRHAPVAVTGGSDRKALAAACETAVRAGLVARLGPQAAA